MRLAVSTLAILYVAGAVPDAATLNSAQSDRAANPDHTRVVEWYADPKVVVPGVLGAAGTGLGFFNLFWTWHLKNMERKGDVQYDEFCARVKNPFAGLRTSLLSIARDFEATKLSAEIVKRRRAVKRIHQNALQPRLFELATIMREADSLQFVHGDNWEQEVEEAQDEIFVCLTTITSLIATAPQVETATDDLVRHIQNLSASLDAKILGEAQRLKGI